MFWYFRDPPWDTNKTPPELFDFIANNPPGRALDLGCGTGTNVITLVKNGWRAVGVDFVPKAIRTAKRNAAKAGILADFKVGDVTKLNQISGSFDLILDIGCFQSLDSAGMEAYRTNIQKFLVPGGTLMLYLFFRSEDKPSGTGAGESDLAPFLDFLQLVQRQDGSERGIRPAAWLTYQKPKG